jgi:myo-inositol-1(or 4)-monophosphatase
MRNPDYAKLLTDVTDAVERAGLLLAAEWRRPLGPRGCGDKAEIDVEIERLLREELLLLVKCDFWGEETGHVLTGHPWCWVLDPNDGTSDFLKGRKGSAIAVGLLHNNLPVLGVVHAPITPQGSSDVIGWAEGMPHLLRNGTSITSNLQGALLTAESLIMVSAAAVEKPALNAELCAPASFYAMPSIAYRLARVAAGDALCGVSLFPVSAHDVVAAHALLRGANGVLVDENGEGISYGAEDKMLTVSKRCFGGEAFACRELLRRDWSRIFVTS